MTATPNHALQRTAPAVAELGGVRRRYIKSVTANLQHLQRCRDGWLTTTNAPTRLEVLLAGTDVGPDSAALAIAERVLANVDQFIGEGIAYLRSFIALPHIGCKGNWEAAGFQFGAGLSIPNADFAVQFGMPDDIYGLWTVGYRHYRGDQLDVVPFAFSRMQF